MPCHIISTCACSWSTGPQSKSKLSGARKWSFVGPILWWDLWCTWRFNFKLLCIVIALLVWLFVWFALVCLFFNVCVNHGSFLGFNLNVVSFSLAGHEWFCYFWGHGHADGELPRNAIVGDPGRRRFNHWGFPWKIRKNVSGCVHLGNVWQCRTWN